VDWSDPNLNPVAGDLTGLPPAVVGGIGRLCEEGEWYAAASLAAGLPAVSVRDPGVKHDFVRKLALFDAAQVAVAEIATVLRRVTAGVL
jgi:acetyl esterase